MITHPFILFFYFLTEKLNRFFSIFHKKRRERNYAVNSRISSVKENVFLEDQSRETGLLYGSKSFSHSGCGTAAVFNALIALKTPVPIADIIRHFEKHGASMSAAFGTSPGSAFKYLKKIISEKTSSEERPPQIRTCASRRKFKSLAESSDVLIFTIMNNRRKITRMIHTMCIERFPDNDQKNTDPASRYIVHNSHGRPESYGSYEEMMASLGDGSGMADGVYMIGIKKA